MKRRHQGMSNFRFGLIALVVLVVVLYFAFTKNNPFTDGYRIQAVFQSAASEITPNSPVRVAGVEVGKVRKVERGDGATAVVTMEIFKRGRPIHRDATAKLRPRLFLEGNFFVDLRPGTGTAPELEEGDTIPLAQTAIPVQFDELLSILDADTRASTQDMFRGFADSLDGGGAEALNRGYDDWEGAFRDSAITLESMRGERTHDLADFVRSQARISSTLAERRPQLGSLLTGYRQTLEAFADRQDELRATIRGSEQLLATAPAALADLDRALPPLRAVAAALRPALRIAPPILDRSRPFLAATAALLDDSELPALARDLGPAVRSLDTLNDRLLPLLPKVTQVSRCAQRNIIPTLKKEAPDGHLSTDQPIWQDGLRFGLALTGGQQNFDGNGFSTRYSFALDQNSFGTLLNTAENLIQLTGSPLLGARPKWTPGYEPPLNGDAPCEDQEPPSLETETVGAPSNQRAVKLEGPRQMTRKSLRERLSDIVADLRKRAKR